MSIPRRIFYLTVAFLCLGAAALIVRETGMPSLAGTDSDSISPAPYPSLRIGETAPTFTLPTSTFSFFTLRPLESGLNIISFWATWCAPCREEMIQLQALHESDADAMQIIAINMGESHSTVRQWVDDLGLTYPVLLDARLNVAARYQVRGLPTTILLDSHLRVIEILYGPVSPETLRLKAKRLLAAS